MALTLEWEARIKRWRAGLKENFYRSLGLLDVAGFTTLDQLTARQALSGTFKPIKPGARWGAKWEYGWFKTTVVLPAGALNRRIELKMDVGAESRILVNGSEAGGRDPWHESLPLTGRGKTGQRFKILVEAYAGHGPHVCSVGPATPPGRITVPEPPSTQAAMGQCTFGIWEEDVYQLWCDVETLYGLRSSLDHNLLRVDEIDTGLREFTLLVDLEAPYVEMLNGIRAARKRLKPLLNCINGSTAPLLYAFGHSHIDVAWLWPLAETERKCARTIGTQLALMTQYPEFKFLQSQPHLYGMTKRLYPEVYARLRNAVRRGQFIPEGGMWVEADTNISGGESLIRQFIHGKRFFRDEFGINSELLWLPDVFGYSGNMPQLMRGCGIKYFSTAKIFWNYYGGEPFPFNTFIWEGIDGSEVLAHFCTDYSSCVDPESLQKRWNERVQKGGINARLLPFGYGDGGGGPTRDHLEYLRRARNLEGLPKTRMASPLEFFRDLEKRGTPEARYVGELYFQCHRGTYTSQARTKRGNRKSEFALREAELWSVVARALHGFKIPLASLDTMWKKVLLNQFHDIIPGSSIRRVYVEANQAYAEVIRFASNTTRQAVARLSGRGRGVVVFNSLAWNRSALVPLPRGIRGARNEAGDPLPVQDMNGIAWTEVTVPSCGWTTIHPQTTPLMPANAMQATDRRLENEVIRIIFNAQGEITSIFDKETGRELAAGLCNSLKMYKDVPSNWDAWDIDSMYKDTPVPLTDQARIKVTARGPLYAVLHVTRRLKSSMMEQEIRLRRNSRCVEFHTIVDWKESHHLLKAAFPVNIHSHEALHEIQFGHIRRPTHGSRPFDADRFEVACQKWSALCEENQGIAILNDCKYGVDVSDNSINLTLLRSPLAPDMTADKGRQEFTYAFYAWNGGLMESRVVREAYELNVPVFSVPGKAGAQSLFRIDAPNIMIETIKPAEDGSPHIIVRLYETMRSATRCVLETSLPFKSAIVTDMLERKTQGKLDARAGKIKLSFRPFEIKTIRLQIK
ncbi:MAG: alpha-mannosidase [Verrucomicrobia bacterium]|nr:alpha-mannosidase [Verrucomicrobiota bacterium]MBU4246749.1 alpha-mannosidase [Verrucomicrobiota bacterium]MBU4291170.1 alpha-mannosidase [Verrucomicrobiota bacterium]MBU4496928.1 alpha-mannosidase [Verrucomicrobiota bacterium]MCG2681909.1 glycosyl hydrolase-related protein [Kiritimatiellia bacterium]